MPVEAVAPQKAAVTGAIRTAAKATGVSFDYLLATAKVESGLNPHLTARTSSATGLFQFLDQTWLGTLKQAGPSLGYGNYAKGITRTAEGRYEVADPLLRREIMALRKEPTANSLMGGAFTRMNASALAKRIGRAPSEAELYMAHFFGSTAGARMISLAGSNPTANAAEAFPAAARANGQIFYDRQGRARSVAGVYSELTRRYQIARAQTAPAAIQVAAVPRQSAPIATTTSHVPYPTAPIAGAVASRGIAPAVRASGVMAFAADPPVANAFNASVAPATTSAPPAQVGPSFSSLFHVAERREAISPVVAQLWGGRAQHAPEVHNATPAGGAALDLFRDMTPNLRALFEGKG